MLTISMLILNRMWKTFLVLEVEARESKSGRVGVTVGDYTLSEVIIAADMGDAS